jgi:hypothetical protein
MLNPSDLAFMMKRISFALALVALIASSSLADTTVRKLRIWPSDTSPGLVKGQLKIDNLITDDSGFSLEVGVGTSSKVFDFPPEIAAMAATAATPVSSTRQANAKPSDSSEFGNVVDPAHLG